MVDSDPNRLLGSAEMCKGCGIVQYVPRQFRNNPKYTRSTYKCSSCGGYLAGSKPGEWVDPDF